VAMLGRTLSASFVMEIVLRVARRSSVGRDGSKYSRFFPSIPFAVALRHQRLITVNFTNIRKILGAVDIIS
jgi:hypothetical protein